MKTFLILILLHITFFILGTIIFVLSFHTVLFENINVLFYRGIILLVIACLLMMIFLIFYKKSVYGSIFTYRDVLLSIVLIFCLNLVVFTHLPVTADRSVSVFILGSINKYQDKGLTEQEIAKMFIEKYLYKYKAIDKRLNEQMVSKNIVYDGTVYKITKQGSFLVKLYAFIADIFNINKRFIFP